MKDYQLIVLDRDGVINIDNEGYINDPNRWHAFPGSLEAIARLNQANKLVSVASNQSGIGRGLITEPQLAAVHQKMENDLQQANGKLDGIFFCPHHPDDNCECRKPKTLMLEKMQQQFNVPKEKMLFIGDSPCDINLGRNFGCDFHLVLTGYGRKTAENEPNPDAIVIHDDLAQAVTYILGKSE